MSMIKQGVGRKKYRTIVVDPPWPYKADRPFGASKEFRPNSWNTPTASPSARARYKTMTMDELKDLKLPADEDSHLYLWVTNSFLEQSHQLARSWGFEPKTLLTWVKMKPNGTPSMKMGYYFRGATEHILFCVKGKLRTKLRDLPTAYLWPRLGKHSQKPNQAFELIEKASYPPYLEMFARRKRLGWDVWGNEVESDIQL